MSEFEATTMMGTDVRLDWDEERAWVDGEEQDDFAEHLEKSKRALEIGEFEEIEGDVEPLLD